MVKTKHTTMLIYLLAIQELSKRKQKIRNNDLTKILNINASSVSEMLDKLKATGYLTGDEIELTNKGKQLIVEYKNRFI